MDGLKVKGAVVALNVSFADKKSLTDEQPCQLSGVCQIMAAFSLFSSPGSASAALEGWPRSPWRPGQRTSVGEVFIWGIKVCVFG